MRHYTFRVAALTACLGLAVSLAVLLLLKTGTGRSPADLTRTPQPSEEGTSLLASLPLSFVENQGQWDTQAKFLAKRGGLQAWFEPDAITLQLAKQASEETLESIVVRLAFEGTSKSAAIEGEQEQRGRYNYFLGNDPAKWHTDVPGYAAVRYEQLYEGIDLRVREHEGRLEYDLLLQPEADLRQVVIRTEGVEELELTDDGTLLMHTALGPIEQKAPTTWYALPDGTTQPVAAQFVLLDEFRYTFAVPHRNPQLALVIDPGLVYSTLLGGSHHDLAYAVAAYPSGEVVLTGITYSSDFPTTPGAYQRAHQGGFDVFVAKLIPAGNGLSDLAFSTFLGGLDGGFLSLGDWGFAIALDRRSNPLEIVVAGLTDSPSFPTTPGAYQTQLGSGTGGVDGFVSRLSGDGARLLASTYLGGGNADEIHALVLAQDDTGDVFVTGYTKAQGLSPQFPTTPGAYQTQHRGGPMMGPSGRICNLCDAFVSRLSRDLRTLVASTYLGGSGNEQGVTLAMRTPTVVAVAGTTESADFPVYPNQPPPGGQAFQTTQPGYTDGFVTYLRADLTRLHYSTYLGGTTHWDFVNGLVLDAQENAVVTGDTYSTDFPTTPGAFQPRGPSAVFVSKLGPHGLGHNDLLYSTYLGAGGAGHAIVMDPSSEFVTIGGNSSPGWPTTPGAFQPTCPMNPSGPSCYSAAVVAKLRLSGLGAGDLLYSTYLAGSSAVGGVLPISSVSGLAHHPSGVVTAVGRSSGAFPTTPGSYQPNPPPSSPLFSVNAFASWVTLMAAGYEIEGSDTSPCAGPLTLRGEGTMPQGGATLLLAVTNGPPNAAGVIAFATSRARQGPWNVDPATIFLVLPVHLNATGFGSLNLTVPSGIPQGMAFHAQSGVVCPGDGPDVPISFSNGLRITIQ